MTEKKWIWVFILLNLIFVNGIILGVLNMRYPLVGHDYILGLPSMLDTAIHYRLNGLSIQWFTSSFGGGIPAFPNPNNMQFSLPAFLSVLLPPWDAVMLMVVIYVTVGFLVCYYFLHKTLQMHWTASLLGSVFFSANGFIISRVAPGHLGYFTFPLLTVFLVSLFDTSLPVKFAAVMVGLLAGILINSAGYFILIVFALSILITTPLIFIHAPHLINAKRFLIIILLGSVIGFLVSASKLAATFTLMSHFHRNIADDYSVSFLSGFFGFIMQFLAVPTLFPAFAMSGMNPDDIPPFLRVFTGTQYGLWEMDTSITPVVFIILLIFLISFLYNFRKNQNKLSTQNKIALVALLCFAWLGIEFTLAKGIIYPAIRNLPILNSLRANVRFASMFIFPITFTATIIYNKWLQTWTNTKVTYAFLLTNLLALLPFGFYFMFKTDIYWQIYDIKVPQQIYADMIAGKSFEVTAIGNTQHFNSGALLTRVSNLNLYEPLFGPELQDFHPQVTVDSIWKIVDGYYNMTNPIGFMYPAQNHVQPFQRFRVTEKDQLTLFAKHIQPDWHIPVYQQVLDWVSGLGFIVTVLYVFIQGLKMKSFQIRT
jgi:hypothetical protein